MTTQHTHQVVFGRKVAGCPRCVELAAGAKPVTGWGAQKRQFQAMAIRDIRSHDCRQSGCSVVCTFGDY